MSEQDKYSDIGNRIQQSVADALSSGDFSKLNVEITSSVREVLSEVGEQINNAVSDAKSGVNTTGRSSGSYQSINDAQGRGFTSGAKSYYDTADADILRHQERREALRKKQTTRIKFEDIGRVTSVLNIWSGSFLIVLFGLAMLGSLGDGTGILEMMLLFLGFAFGIFSCVKGTIKKKWLKLARQYRDIAKEKQYATVNTISEATGTNQAQVIKNIKKILSKGFFPEGYLDETNTTFMVTKAMYEQYLETKNNQIVTEEASNVDSKEAELNSMISVGMRYVDRLRELNDRIPGVVITEKLNRLEKLLNEIFNGLREHPDQMVNCRKLMEYYLPTMIKLVEAYAEYDKVSQPGQDILDAKKEIENTLNTINQAFVELLNKLYQNSVWDVTAEAKVLKTMLHQAGLTEGVTEEEEEEELFGVTQADLDEQVVNNV